MQIIIVIVSLILMNFSICYGSTEIIISKKNEYGGQTIETRYSKNDSESKNTVKAIAFLDHTGEIAKIEYYYTDLFSSNNKGGNKAIIFIKNRKVIKQENYYKDNLENILGLSKLIIYYDNNDRPTRYESYYLNESASKRGFNRAILIIDPDGASRAEYLMTSEYSSEMGLDKVISYFSKDRKLAKIEYYKDGKVVVLPEDKTFLIRSKLPKFPDFAKH